MIEETAKSFAVYSKHDADAWRELKAKANMFELVMAAALYTPPAKWNPSESLPNPMLATQSSFSMFGLDEEMAFKTVRDCIDEYFEADEVRALLYRVAIEFAAPQPGMARVGLLLPVRMFMPGCWRMMVGGTHRLNGAMVTACIKEGVTMRESSRVKRIVLEGGRAVGVELVDGKRLMAKRAVVSAIGLKDTLLDMVGAEHLSDYTRRRAAHLEDRPGAGVGGHGAAPSHPSTRARVGTQASTVPGTRWSATTARRTCSTIAARVIAIAFPSFPRRRSGSTRCGTRPRPPRRTT